MSNEPMAIGPHRLLCGDITEGIVSTLMRAELADVVYSDPPWGPGNQQYWHTMRLRGSVPRTSWASFLESFANACVEHSKQDAPVFVEMGMRWADQLADTMVRRDLAEVTRWVVTYGPRKRPLPVTILMFAHPSAATSDRVTMMVRAIEHEMPTHGEPVTAHVLRAAVRPGMTVLDPCTGLGMTARWAHKLGGCFRGTEMNASRLERTASWLRSQASS